MSFIRKVEETIMREEQQRIKQSWLQIMTILQTTGYDFMYQEEISCIASIVRKEIYKDEK